jgi:hypothetical protein
MKKLLLFLSLIYATSLMANQVVVDPATYDTVNHPLPAGMTIVEIDGINYFQIITNGWNSLLPVYDTIIVNPSRTHFRMQAKFELGTSDTLPYEGVQTFLKLGNYRVSPQVEIGASGVASSKTFKSYQISIAKKDTVTGVQVAGQEKTNWGPTTGDTLWIGKVEIITYDANAVLDPGSIDPDSLPAGMSIDMIDGVEYVKVILDGWNSMIPVKHRIVTTASTHFTTKAKLHLGTSDTIAFSNVNTFLKLANFVANPQKEIGAAGNASSLEFTTYQIAIALRDTITGVQVAGQEKTNWGPITGDTLWIGKVTLIDKGKPTAPGSLTATPADSSVTLTWTASTDNVLVKAYIVKQDGVKIDSLNALTKTVTGLANGNYVFTVTAVDNSGNYSNPSTANATVNTDIKVISGIQFTIRPNPATSVISLNKSGDLTIYDIAGKMVMRISNYKADAAISVSQLKSGMYYVRNISNGNASTMRFIKR